MEVQVLPSLKSQLVWQVMQSAPVNILPLVKALTPTTSIQKKCEGFVNACGLLLKNGKRNHVWEIKITDENETLISQITVVNALVPQKL